MSYLPDSTQRLQAETLAAFLPDGKMFRAKYINESNLNKLLLGFGAELLRVHQTIDEFVCNYLINNSSFFIDEWELMVGIPDDCFPGAGSIEERTQHVLVKLASLNVIVEQDWIDLAAILGFEICIKNGGEAGIYPLSYPIEYFATAKEARFTMIVFIKGIPPTVYPLTYPLNYSSSADNILICVFEKLKPADTNLLFRFVDALPC